jgi:putative FmdB family regulatory protein
MAIYEFACENHGPFDVMLPLGTAPSSLACPTCGNGSARVFSAPMLRTGRAVAWTAALDHAQKSRHEPDVVTSLPRTSRRSNTVAMTPVLQGLPRPGAS